MRYLLMPLLILFSVPAYAFDLDGHTDFSRILGLNSSVSARVAALHTSVGARVVPGQLLLSLDPTALAADVAIARAEMEALLPDIARQQAELERARELYDRDSLALIELQRAEQDHSIARARHAAAEARYERARFYLSQAEIRSPIAGIVLSIDTFPGQYINTRVSDQVLLTIADTHRMIASALLPIELLDEDLLNHQARVRYRDRFFDGEVVQLGRQIATGANNHPAMTLVVRFATAGDLPAGLPVEILIDE